MIILYMGPTKVQTQVVSVMTPTGAVSITPVGTPPSKVGRNRTHPTHLQHAPHAAPGDG